MGQEPDVVGLPQLLRTIVRPWLNAVAMNPMGMGQDLHVSATNAATSLRRRVELTAGLDVALRNAEEASAELAAQLDMVRSDPTRTRSLAMTSLEALLLALSDARPNASTIALGLGW